MSAPLVALLTDFGGADGYVGVMKAVILGIAPGVPVIDLSHEVPPQDVRSGAWILHTSWRFLPEGSICLGVVDPGVGTARRPVAFASAGRLFVGPDNGLFGYVLAASPATAAVLLDYPRYQLAPPSSTFHGRDIFAPAAGHLAAGLLLAALGSPVEPSTLAAQALPRPWPHPEGLLGQVVYVDHFGNLITSFGPELASDLLRHSRLRLQVGQTTVTAAAPTFAAGPAEAPFALLDSSGHLAIAVRDGSAAARLGVGRGSEVLAVGARAPAGAGEQAVTGADR
jgi:S-adenosylmethionine hydrolase